MARGTKLRAIRIDDELWEAAGEAAEAEGTDRSEVAREAFKALVERQG